MIDSHVLTGASIRDKEGNKGEILKISMPWVRVAWWVKGQDVPRVQCYIRSDERLRGMEVLTITDGWVAADKLVGSKKLQNPQEVEKCEIEEELLDEAGKDRSPFKRSKKNGPAISNKIKKKTDKWDCSGSNYRYVCVSKKGKDKGRKKIITRKKDAKAKYQKLYKKWWSARQDVAAANTRLKKKVFKKK